MISPSPETRESASLVPAAFMLTSTRTIVDTGVRMIYPLLPVFARGVNVEIGAIVSVLTLMQLLGLVAPFIGRISEQRGRKFTILLGLLIYIAGMLSVFLLPRSRRLSVPQVST